MQLTLRLTVVTVLLAAAVALVGAGGANATVTRCTGTHAVSFSPPLTNTPQPVTVSVDNDFPLCLSLADPTLTSGWSRHSVVSNVSCTSLLTSGSANDRFAWSNGQTSTFAFDFAVTLVNGSQVIEQLGTIAAGEFAGAEGVGVATLPALDLGACAGAGLRRVSGPYLLTIVG